MTPEIQFRIHILNGLLPVTLMARPITVVDVNFLPVPEVVFFTSGHYAIRSCHCGLKISRTAEVCFGALVALLEGDIFVLSA